VLARVGDEEEGPAAAVVNAGEARGASEREAGAVLLKGQSFEPAPVVVPRVRVPKLNDTETNYNYSAATLF
jgi:hypothetical protein